MPKKTANSPKKSASVKQKPKKAIAKNKSNKKLSISESKKPSGSRVISAPVDGNKFGEVVLCPGDPFRARWMANKYLKDAEMITNVRGMMGFTGMYEGARVSIMATGMGMPSASIYWRELITVYGVKNIIRTGTCGTTKP